MKKQWAFSTYLYSLCFMLFGVLLVVGSFSHFNIEKLAKLTNQITNNEMPAVREMTLIDMFHDGLRAVTFRSLLTLETKNPEERQATKAEFKEFADEIKSHINNLKKLPDLNPETKAAIDAAIPEVEAYVLAVEKVVQVATEGNRNEAYSLMPDFFKRFEALEAQLEVLGKKIESNSKNSSLAANHAADFAKKTNFGMIILFSILGFGYAVVLIRKLKNSIIDATSKLSAETVQVTSTSTEINSAAKNLSNSASNQAAAIQQAVAALDEITAMVKKTSDNSDNLANSAKTSSKSATEGQQAIGDMLQAMDVISDSQSRIVRQVEDGNQKINEIVKVIGEIGDKTKVINDIVFQTKLLSFNASVEAARAGEHGKGFAVVAEEVGNLAQMSGNAAKEISDMLTGSMERVWQIVSENKQKVEALITEGKSKLESGTDVAKRCGTALNEIVQQSQSVGQMIEQITTAIHEQNLGLQEVSKSVQSLDQSTHENAAMSRQTTATSETLNQRAVQLLSIVQQLETVVHGHAVTKKQNIETTPKPSGKENLTAKIIPIATISSSKQKAEPEIKATKKPEAAQPLKIETKKVPVKQTAVQKMAVGSSVVPSHDDPRFEDI